MPALALSFHNRGMKARRRVGFITLPDVSGIYTTLVGVLWLVWALYWLVSAAHVKATQRRESAGSRSLHMGPMVLAAVLLAAPHLPDVPLLYERFVPAGAAGAVPGCLLVLAGLALSAWARVHLGSNWSGRVTLKENHELIRTGPYAIVRHPIYTGLLLAIAGTALVRGEWRGLLAVVLMGVSYWRKLRVEERLLSGIFGDSYRRYCESTSALIPYLL
jgi:protein-S-isoprenylcysteine O-methyltransferase Ste14